MGNVLKEICVITGLRVEDGVAKEFTSVFIKFILTYYSILTPAEIVLAFTLNAANELPEKVELFFPNLTIEQVGKVLHQYKIKRGALAKKIINSGVAEIDQPKISKEDEIRSDKSFCNDYYTKFLNKELTNVSLSYAYMVYDYLEKYKVISLTNKEKQEYFQKARRIREESLAAPAKDRVERKEKIRLMEDYLNNDKSQSEINLLRSLSKRLVLFDFMERCKSKNLNVIFNYEEKDGDTIETTKG